MTVREHLYPIPSDAELQQMVGAATPHFALQIRERVGSYLAQLTDDDPRRMTLIAQMDHLEALASGGETGHAGQAELPSRPSLVMEPRAPGEEHA
jgi:hypothetical protein